MIAPPTLPRDPPKIVLHHGDVLRDECGNYLCDNISVTELAPKANKIIRIIKGDRCQAPLVPLRVHIYEEHLSSGQKIYLRPNDRAFLLSPCSPVRTIVDNLHHRHLSCSSASAL